MTKLYEAITEGVEQVASSWGEQDSQLLESVSAENQRQRHHRGYTDVSDVVLDRLRIRFADKPSYQKPLQAAGGVDFFLKVMLRHISHITQSAQRAGVEQELAIQQIAEHYKDPSSTFAELSRYPGVIVGEHERGMGLLTDQYCYFDPERNGQFDWREGRLAARSLSKELDGSRNYLIQQKEETGPIYDERGREINPEGRCPASDLMPRMGSAVFEICAKEPSLAPASLNANNRTT